MPFFGKQKVGANSPSRIAAPVTSNIGEALGAVGQAGAELYERIQVSKDKDTAAEAAGDEIASAEEAVVDAGVDASAPDVAQEIADAAEKGDKA